MKTRPRPPRGRCRRRPGGGGRPRGGGAPDPDPGGPPTPFTALHGGVTQGPVPVRIVSGPGGTKSSAHEGGLGDSCCLGPLRLANFASAFADLLVHGPRFVIGSSPYDAVSRTTLPVVTVQDTTAFRGCNTAPPHLGAITPGLALRAADPAGGSEAPGRIGDPGSALGRDAEGDPGREPCPGKAHSLRSR